MRRELSLVGASLRGLCLRARARLVGHLWDGSCERARGRMGDTRQCCPCPYRAVPDRAGLALRAHHLALGTDRCRRRADP